MAVEHARFFLGLTLLLVVGAWPLAVPAQDGTSKTNSVTGCLQKGVEPGGFTITGEDGTVWELTGKVDAAHVGHKVTVSGHSVQKSKTDEAKLADDEKQEANGKPYADFRVSSLKMISESCP